MDFSYFDANAKAPELNSPEQVRDEIMQLNEVADKLGSYRWSYKDDFAGEKGVDTEEHFGPVAQQLLEIPGLAGAVIQDEDGTLKVNTDYAALAALGLVAALARVVLGKNGKNGDGTTEDSTESNAELPGTVSDEGTIPSPTASEEENTEAVGEGTTDEVGGEALQPALETDEAADNTGDTSGLTTEPSTGASTTTVEE